MAAVILPLFYTILFILLIYKANFFAIPGVSKLGIIAVFLLKITFGTLLWAFYTFSDNGTAEADIYKYFNDSQIICQALVNRPADYVNLITGIADHTPYFHQTYYSKMNFWYGTNESNLIPDARTVIRFNAVVRVLSLGNYHVHTVFMCFLSLLGLVFLYKTFVNQMDDKKQLLVISIFLMPTVLFWGSGVLKEGLLLLGLGMFFHSLLQLLNSGYSLKQVALLIMGITVLLTVKIYVLICCLPFLIAYMLSRKSSIKQILINYLSVAAGAFLLIIAVHYSFPSYSVLKTLSRKQNDFLNLAKGGVYLANDSITIWISATVAKPIIATSDSGKYKIKKGIGYCYWKNAQKHDTLYISNSSDTGTYSLLFKFRPAGSVVHVPRLKPDVANFIGNSGYAFYYAFYSPEWRQANTISKKLSWFENTIILLFIFTCMLFHKSLRSINLNLFLLCLFFSLTLYLLVGLTTPIAGAIMRYKMPAIPFLLTACLLLFDIQKFKEKLGLTHKTKAN